MKNETGQTNRENIARLQLEARAATLAGNYDWQAAAIEELERVWHDHAAAKAFYDELEALTPNEAR